MFRLSNDKELTLQDLSDFLAKHRNMVMLRYKPLMDAYETKYPIFSLPPKPDFKPDKRIAVNFAKYIVDTMNGFFIGIPIKIDCDDPDIADYVDGDIVLVNVAKGEVQVVTDPEIMDGVTITTFRTLDSCLVSLWASIMG